MPHFNKKMLSFFVTTKCNLCCRYCYNADERRSISEQTIDLNFAKTGIDWYFTHYPYRHIRFYGPGEPTQAFEEMKNMRSKNLIGRTEEISLLEDSNG